METQKAYYDGTKEAIDPGWSVSQSWLEKEKYGDSTGSTCTQAQG